MIRPVDAESVSQPQPGQSAVSGWLLVDQAMINAFTAATQDNQWIHNDVERAKAELPGGTTIAQGYLLLSLLPRLSRETFGWDEGVRRINYGSNKVRFLTPVPPGARVRLRQTVKSVDDRQGGKLVTFENVLEFQGQDRPAMIAESLVLLVA